MFVNLINANLALILSTLAGTVIPAVSALLTKRPSGWTGLATLVLSAVAGFVGEWAASSDVHTYDWRHGLTTAVSALLVAFLSHKVLWQDTRVIGKLHATGSRV